MSQFRILILACLMISMSSSWFIPGRLAIIDEHSHNYIVRGNLPVAHKEFQIHQLHEALQNLTGVEPGSYSLVVVSLMNTLTPKQTKNLYIEEKYFDQHPQYTYINHMVLGSFIDPKDVPKWLRNYIVPVYESLSIDDLDVLLQKLRKSIYRKTPTIVYVHCSQGVDRTGYVHAAYSMKYQNKSLEDAYKFNLAVLKNMRNRMHFNTYYGIQWYCLYLGRSDEECLKGLQP